MKAFLQRLHILREAIPVTCSPSNIRLLQQQLETFRLMEQEGNDVPPVIAKDWGHRHPPIKRLLEEAANIHLSWAQQKALFEQGRKALLHEIDISIQALQ